MELRISILKTPAPGKVEPVFDDLGDDWSPAEIADPEHPVLCVIQPRGTVGGRGLVNLRFRTRKGREVVLRVTAAMWDSVQGALFSCGAIDRNLLLLSST